MPMVRANPEPDGEPKRFIRMMRRLVVAMHQRRPLTCADAVRTMTRAAMALVSALAIGEHRRDRPRIDVRERLGALPAADEEQERQRRTAAHAAGVASSR